MKANKVPLLIEHGYILKLYYATILKKDKLNFSSNSHALTSENIVIMHWGYHVKYSLNFCFSRMLL